MGYSSYSQYLKANGGNANTYNPFLMSRAEFSRYQDAQKTAANKRRDAEADVKRCQDAVTNATAAGLLVDAAHAQVNLNRAITNLKSL